MEKYMNAPMEPSWAFQDIIAEYEISKDKKTISRRYQIPVSGYKNFERDSCMWKIGEECFFVESGHRVISGKIVQISGDFLLVRYGTEQGTRLRSSKVYHTEEEAQKHMHVEEPKKKRIRSPYDYWH